MFLSTAAILFNNQFSVTLSIIASISSILFKLPLTRSSVNSLTLLLSFLPDQNSSRSLLSILFFVKSTWNSICSAYSLALRRFIRQNYWGQVLTFDISLREHIS